MQKYCIVPQKTNKFWLLVKGMELTEETKRLFQHCFIKQVEISPNQKTWKIVLAAQELVDDTLLAAAADHIKQRCGLSEVFFSQDVVDMETILTTGWLQLVDRVTAFDPKAIDSSTSESCQRADLCTRRKCDNRLAS